MRLKKHKDYIYFLCKQHRIRAQLYRSTKLSNKLSYIFLNWNGQCNWAGSVYNNDSEWRKIYLVSITKEEAIVKFPNYKNKIK